MGLVKTLLKISKQVAAQTEDCEVVTPPSGLFFVTKFHGSGVFNPNASVKLIWDFEGAGEEILWTINGSSDFTEEIERTGDGVKKLAVCLDNSMTGPVFLSGYAKIVWED